MSIVDRYNKCWETTARSSPSYKLTVSKMDVEVVRKLINNLHLGVYPPHGHIRVAAPFALGLDAVRLAIVDKLS